MKEGSRTRAHTYHSSLVLLWIWQNQLPQAPVADAPAMRMQPKIMIPDKPHPLKLFISGCFDIEIGKKTKAAAKEPLLKEGQ